MRGTERAMVDIQCRGPDWWRTAQALTRPEVERVHRHAVLLVPGDCETLTGDRAVASIDSAGGRVTGNLDGLTKRRCCISVGSRSGSFCEQPYRTAWQRTGLAPSDAKTEPWIRSVPRSWHQAMRYLLAPLPVVAGRVPMPGPALLSIRGTPSSHPPALHAAPEISIAANACVRFLIARGDRGWYCSSTSFWKVMIDHVEPLRLMFEPCSGFSPLCPPRVEGPIVVPKAALEAVPIP